MKHLSQFKPVFIFILSLGWLLILGTVIFSPDTIIELGHNIAQKDMLTDYIKGLAWFFVLGVTIFFWPIEKENKKALFAAWLVKGLVVLGFMLFYESYYGLDAFMYFDEAVNRPSMFNGFRFGESGTSNMIGLTILQQKIIPNSYHAAKVTCAFIGLIAIYLFYRAVVIFMRKEIIGVFYLIALWPSNLFWSSILGKDPIVFLGICMYIYGVMGWYRNLKIKYILILAAGILVAMFIRVWLGVIFLVPTGMFVLQRMKNIAIKIFFIVLIGAALIYSMQYLIQFINVETIDEAVEKVDTFSQGMNEGGSSRAVPVRFTGMVDLIKFLPLGIFTILFRPLPWEIGNFFGVLTGLENLVLLLLFLRALTKTKANDFKNPVIQWLLALVLIWSTVYGPYVFQNAGTSVRQRLQILPVFISLILYVSYKRGDDYQIKA